VKKVLKYIFICLIVIIGALMIYLKFVLPKVGAAPEMKVEITPERVERGKYLANAVCVCMDCHSTRDWSRFSGPPVAGTIGKGGERFGEEFGFPGTYYSKNITPFALKDWTDGEIFRAITCGVSKDGHALFPVMPYFYYGQMDEEDTKSIIAYLRTLEPIDNIPPASESNFPMNFIINTIPKKGVSQKMPPKSDLVSYGKYLATSAGCVECHTPFEKGQIVQGKEFSGGREFPFPNGNVLRSPNISPDIQSGIGSWNEIQFVQLFKLRSDSAALNQKVMPNDFNTIMPWTMYGKMDTTDLKAIFAYLRTLTPIKNEVEKFTARK
jgi:cytochrome c2